MKTALVVIVCLVVSSACKYTGTVAPPPADACMPYTYTATMTLPAGVTGTLGTVAGFPASLTVAAPSVTGTPTWLDAGSSPFPISASGTVTTPVPWWRTAAWSASASFVVNPPPTSFAPPGGFTIPADVQLSNVVVVSVAPGGTVACPYTANYPNRLPGMASITVIPPSPQASDPNDDITLQLSRQGAGSTSGTMTVTLVPTAGGPNVTVSIPYTVR